MTKLRDVYLALADLSNNGYCDATQEQIAQLANVSIRHLRRLIPELRDLGAIRTELIHNQRGHRHKTRYRLISLEDSQSPVGSKPRGLPESGRPSLEDSQSPVGSPRGLPESGRLPFMIHDNDEDRNLNRKLILAALDFLDLNGRLKLLNLPHLDLGYAELARRYVDHLKATKQWQAQYSPGRVYRLIEQEAVPTQFEMPAGVAELPAEEKAWYSQDELNLIER